MPRSLVHTSLSLGLTENNARFRELLAGHRSGAVHRLERLPRHLPGQRALPLDHLGRGERGAGGGKELGVV